MNIIFDHNQVEQLKGKYTVLELDTFGLPDGTIRAAHCVIQNVTLESLSRIQSLMELHDSLISNFKDRNWLYCEEVIKMLIGSWGGELDTFYINLQNRVKGYIANEPPENWTHIIQK
jgi:hypothetical protein